ncbi:YkoP family protein [Paenibacillus thalictri]|uniref:YkoP-like domain-containing protein n=1 Tax=Paenibacillus thalictri TaxID=2527873 RepID=A0A4Q9DMB7_9BACL|nr:hypothetical protein [Paenibacillus thalictri]TBL75758.1 hypothetical protein EYB31_22505 [Paenibacillus thalictri]
MAISAGKKSIVYLWLKWDELFHLMFRLRLVDENRPMFYYRICAYRGPVITLPGGEVIAKGDRVVELHFNNRMLVGMAAASRSSVHLAVQLIRNARDVLPAIADKLSGDPAYHGVKGVYGITMIHRGTEQLGFTQADLPGRWLVWIMGLYLRGLLSGLHSAGKMRLRENPEANVPKVIVMSARELVQRYAAKG